MRKMRKTVSSNLSTQQNCCSVLQFEYCILPCNYNFSPTKQFALLFESESAAVKLNTTSCSLVLSCCDLRREGKLFCWGSRSIKLVMCEYYYSHSSSSSSSFHSGVGRVCCVRCAVSCVHSALTFLSDCRQVSPNRILDSNRTSYPIITKSNEKLTGGNLIGGNEEKGEKLLKKRFTVELNCFWFHTYCARIWYVILPL